MPQATYAFGDSMRPDTPTYSLREASSRPRSGTRAGKACAQLVAQLARCGRAPFRPRRSQRPAATTTPALFKSTPPFLDGLEETSFTGAAGMTQATPPTAFASSALERAPAPTVVDGLAVACGLLHALGHAAEVQADGAVLEGHDAGDDGGVLMGRPACRRSSSCGAWAPRDTTAGAPAPNTEITVSAAPSRRSLPAREMRAILSATASGASPKETSTTSSAMVASASAKPRSGIRAFSDNEYFHEYQLCLSTAARDTGRGNLQRWPGGRRRTARWRRRPRPRGSPACGRPASAQGRHDADGVLVRRRLPATFIGFLPAARMSFMPGMRGSARCRERPDTTAGSGTSDDLDHVLERALDPSTCRPRGDLRGGVHHGQAQLRGQLRPTLRVCCTAELPPQRMTPKPPRFRRAGYRAAAAALRRGRRTRRRPSCTARPRRGRARSS